MWQGTVGNLPVHACFDGEDNSGVYYYDAHRRPIRLVNNEGLFAETIGWGEPSETYWQFSAIGGERATGAMERGRAQPADCLAPGRVVAAV